MIIQTSLFDPLIPYLTDIREVKGRFFKVEFWVPWELEFASWEDLSKYFSEVSINIISEPIFSIFNAGPIGRRYMSRTLIGTLKDKELGKYLMFRQSIYLHKC